MYLWKLSIDEDDYGDPEVLIFKRKKDAVAYSKASYKKYLRSEYEFQMPPNVITYDEFIEEGRAKLARIKVRLDGKLEQVIMQNKSRSS